MKVRGYRIELGEIEAVLNEARIGEAERGGGERRWPGEKRLVAYVVREGGRGRHEEKRAYLRERVAGVHGAGGVRGAGEMPLTANGKLDRKGLPDEDEARRRGRSRSMRRRDADRGDVGGDLEEVLRLDRVGMTTTSSRWEGTRCWRRRSSREVRRRFGVEIGVAEHLRGADGGRDWREG